RVTTDRATASRPSPHPALARALADRADNGPVKVFVAGGTGAIGRFLVPMLVNAGHEVTATTRRADGAGWLTSVGATPSILDAFDPSAVDAAMRTARPEILVDQLTDLSAGVDHASLRRDAQLRIGTTPIPGCPA